MSTRKRGILILTIFALLICAEMLLPAVPGTDDVVLAGGGTTVAAIVVIGAAIWAIFGNGNSQKICDANDPDRFKKIADFCKRNNQRD